MRRGRILGRPAAMALAVLVLGASLPFWAIQTEYMLEVSILVLIFAAAGLGWNVIGGYGGMLSFGHSVYFGLGAYTTGLLYIHFHLTPWIGMFCGALVAALAGAVTTYPALRLRGVYFTLATFTVTLLFADFATHFRDFTGGDVGLSIPYRRSAPAEFQFGSRLAYFYVALALLTVLVLVSGAIAASRLGLFLRASRDDVDAARASGVDVTKVRLVGLTVSAAMTGLAGAMLLQSLRFIDPATAFGAATATLISLVALTGGRATVLGPILGAAVLVPLQQVLSSSLSTAPAGTSGMAYAVLVIAVILLDRRGIAHLVPRLAGPLTRALPGRIAGKRASAQEKIDANEI